MNDAADVGPHGVDGCVRAEAGVVNAQGGGALVHHVPDDVYLHLWGGAHGHSLNDT